MTAHVTPLRGPGSPNVLIEGSPAWRLSDPHLCPLSTGVVPHGVETVETGSKTVLINGVPATRVGDTLVGAGPPNTIVTGASTVLIGGGTTGRSGETGETATPEETTTDPATTTAAEPTTQKTTADGETPIGPPGSLASCAAITDREFVLHDASGTPLVCDFEYADVFGGLETITTQAAETVPVEGTDDKVRFSASQFPGAGPISEGESIPGFDRKETIAFGETDVTLWYTPPGRLSPYGQAKFLLPDTVSGSDKWFNVTITYAQPDAYYGSAEPTESCIAPLADATLRTARSVTPNPDRDPWRG